MCEAAEVGEPGTELARDGGLLQHPSPGEVVEVVHGVGDIVGEVHDGAFDGLHAC